MKIPYSSLPHLRLISLVLFMTLCAGSFGYLWLNSGGKIPGISEKNYQVSFDVPEVANLVYDADVMMAGIPIGKVESVEAQGNHAHVVMRLDSHYPLHKGVSVQIRNKTLVEESYLDITDGPRTAPEVPNGSQLPRGTAKPTVELNEILESLDRPTRDALGSAIQSLGASTNGGRGDISRALTGLGALGREGSTVLDALADQSKALNSLAGKTATLLTALDTRHGQIARLVSDANVLTKTTAHNNQRLQAVMRKMPGLFDNTRRASASLTTLSSSLEPVAADLAAASPQLSAALQQLPQTSRDLRAIMPVLDDVATSAPNTLRRIPMVAPDLRATMSTMNVALCDVNPMLGYMEPYGRDIAAYFTNWGDALSRYDANGSSLRLLVVLNEKSLTGQPVNTHLGPFDKSGNAYPAPGASNDPDGFSGKYPRLHQEPCG